MLKHSYKPYSYQGTPTGHELHRREIVARRWSQLDAGNSPGRLQVGGPRRGVSFITQWRFNGQREVTNEILVYDHFAGRRICTARAAQFTPLMLL